MDSDYSNRFYSTEVVLIPTRWTQRHIIIITARIPHQALTLTSRSSSQIQAGPHRVRVGPSTQKQRSTLRASTFPVLSTSSGSWGNRELLSPPSHPTLLWLLRRDNAGFPTKSVCRGSSPFCFANQPNIHNLTTHHIPSP